MYESIQGELIDKSPARASVRAGGIGYGAQISLATYESLPRPGESVSLLLHLSVREDEWRLFAFATEEERTTFRALIKVSGVGPVVALSLLSGFEPSELRVAVGQGDAKALTRVKGVGKKTAERIVVELREAFGKSAQSFPASALPHDATEHVARDAVQALESLGLDGTEARRRVSVCLDAITSEDELDVADVVRRALRL